MFCRRLLQSGHAVGLSGLLFAAAVVCTCMAQRAAHTASVVTLRNGFTIACTEQDRIAPDTLRLYLQTPGGVGQTSNYIDVARSSVVSIEAAPEAVEPARVPVQPLAAGAAVPLGAILQQSGLAHNVNVALLASVVRAESAGNAHAVSRTGARGLMQLMPGTAAELGVHDSFAPAQNVNGGSAYLDRLLTRYHDDVALALAAYNAGPAAVDRYRGIPPFRETRRYVARVLREFNRLVQPDPTHAAATQAAVVPGTPR